MSEILAAGSTTVWQLIAAQADHHPKALALKDGDVTYSYHEMIIAANRIAADLHQRGVQRGDRIAILSENSAHYTLTQLACAKLGVIVACLNWRLHDAEQVWCIDLVEPALIAASARYYAAAQRQCGKRLVLQLDQLGVSGESPEAAQAEDGFNIIYTSGTTGRPKAAVISQRAQIARMCAFRLDLGLSKDDAYISWAPMFHMGGTEHLFSTLLIGGTGIIYDGFEADKIIDTLENYPIGWMMTVPTTTEALLAALEIRKPKIRGVKAVGSMADMVPLDMIERITKALNAPFLNSFGATETGMPPLSGDLIKPDSLPRSLAKQLSILTQLRLVDANGQDVAFGEVGEAWVKGPTLFSGYWNAQSVNQAAFAGGWFRMGDLFRRTERGYEFAGRSKYMIKSGGENIYPAEIERVLLADRRVADAIVVRKPDEKWGEVPVAIIARHDESLDEAEVITLCKAELAGYKRPKGVVFLALDQFPRSISGKIIREDLEKLVIEA